jgi:subtilisin family serine protease
MSTVSTSAPPIGHDEHMAFPSGVSQQLTLAGQLLGDPAAIDHDHTPLDAICASVRTAMHAAAVSIARLDGGELHYLASDGAGAESIVGTRMSIDRGLAGYVARTGQSLTIDQARADARFAHDIAERTGFVPESLMVLPVVDGREQVLGVVSILDRVDQLEDPFLPAWSEPFFASDGPGVAPHLPLPAPVTPSWAYGDGRGRGVRVAVVDSGIDGSHPLVRGVSNSVSVVRDDSTATGIRFDEGEHDDLYGHGTACAAIVRELAPDVELVSVRVLGPDLKGSVGAFAYGVEWCLEHDVDIVNISMSTASETWAETFYDLIDTATRQRVMLVTAMNNQRKRTIPGEFAGVFSVACAPGHDREHVWCNPNVPAEWGAAGVDTEVAWANGGRMRATGNSFAAPVVAGHLARIVGAHPGITPWQAKAVLAQLSVNAAPVNPVPRPLL